MGADEDKDESRIAPGFEEQIRFLRKARKRGTTRLQKTTEFNVIRKLKRELGDSDRSFDERSLDNRLEQALNRDNSEDIFQQSLSHALKDISSGKKGAEPFKSQSASNVSVPTTGISEGISPGADSLPAGFIESVQGPQSGFLDGETLPESPAYSFEEEDMLLGVAADLHEPEMNRQQDSFLAEFAMLSVQFKQLTGFDLLRESDGGLALGLTACGDSQILYRVPFRREGIEELYTFAAALIEEYVESIGVRFGVEFSYPGEATLHQFVLNEQGQYVRGNLLQARIPRVDELKALQLALEYSWPAVFQADDQLPLRVVFVDDFLVQDQDFGVSLKYLEDGRPLLVISPELSKKGSPTDLDAIGGDNLESWQAGIMRELCWKSAVDCRKFPLSLSEYQTLGWVPLAGAFAGMFALRTTDGQLFMPLDMAAGDDGSWVRCNESGEFVNLQGVPCRAAEEIVYISDRILSGLALVAPVSELFFTAEDEVVEALRVFRQGPEWRAALARKSALLYEMAKGLDQQDINRVYASHNGAESYIRSPGASLVRNNDEKQQEVRRFEEKYLGGKIEGKR